MNNWKKKYFLLDSDSDTDSNNAFEKTRIKSNKKQNNKEIKDKEIKDKTNKTNIQKNNKKEIIKEKKKKYNDDDFEYISETDSDGTDNK